ncbi:MAG: response regulator, partial [Candidatus Scalindua sp.]|nr:response regulator [Candidatus Scalindua sp.]
MKKYNINILVIDDDKDICDSLKKSLVTEGYKVKAISNPMHTFRELKKKEYHL